MFNVLLPDYSNVLTNLSLPPELAQEGIRPRTRTSRRNLSVCMGKGKKSEDSTANNSSDEEDKKKDKGNVSFKEDAEGEKKGTLIQLDDDIMQHLSTYLQLKET